MGIFLNVLFLQPVTSSSLINYTQTMLGVFENLPASRSLQLAISLVFGTGFCF